MIRSFAFTTQGKLHSKDVEAFLMPTLLADTNLFLWVDLEKATPEEIKLVLEDIFHCHPLSIEDCVTASPSPKVEAYNPKDEDKFSPYLFMVIHAVDYSRKDGVFATKELDFFLGENFLVTYHDVPLRAIDATEERCLKSTVKLAHSYTDSLTGILQVYLNMSSNQTGEVVKLLTLITVITTPLMMIGTWYGMNFQGMPELSHKHGYAVAAAVTITSTALTFWYFKKRKWF